LPPHVFQFFFAAQFLPEHELRNDLASKFAVQDRLVGAGQPCLVIAEIAQAHDGSLGTALAYVEAVARAGAGAVKFQTHIADAESTPGEPFRVRFSRQDATRYDYWKRMEFTESQWRELADCARRHGLLFLSTPFSFEAIELLERLEMAAWKVGSGEVTNLPMLERMAATGRPILLSSGMASWEDLDRAVEIIGRHATPLAVLQCTTAYPCPPEKIGLNVLAQLRERFGCPVGLSDHSGTIFASLAAASLGANLLEVHTVFSRECFGPDVAASVTTGELAQLVEGVRFIEQALAHPVEKQAAAAEMADLRAMFGKSVVAAVDLPAGHKLRLGDLALKKPGTGIPAARLEEVVGRQLKRPVAANALLAEENLD
jgi:N-acetylneuraminate synthase